VKTSWIIFIVFVYASIFYFGGVAEYNNLFTPAIASNFKALLTPTGTNFFVAGVMEIVNVWDFVLNLIKMIGLWNGTLWVGSWLYFYWFVCLPVAIAMVVTLVFVLRGVHNS
jgi:hypothetical protein